MVFEQNFSFSLVDFCPHAAILLRSLLFFLIFLDQIFQMVFLNPFIVHSRPSFLL